RASLATGCGNCPQQARAIGRGPGCAFTEQMAFKVPDRIIKRRLVGTGGPRGVPRLPCAVDGGGVRAPALSAQCLEGSPLRLFAAGAPPCPPLGDSAADDDTKPNDDNRSDCGT